MHLSDDHHLLKIQRLRFGCSQNAERWQFIAEHLGRACEFIRFI